MPQGQPPFISGWAMGDRCPLNGLAISEDGRALAWVIARGESDSETARVLQAHSLPISWRSVTLLMSQATTAAAE